MNAPKSAQAFPDCREFLNRAIAEEESWGIVFAAKGTATNFRLRCYTTRRRELLLNSRLYTGPTEEEALARKSTVWDGLLLLVKEVEDGWAVLAMHDGRAALNAQIISQGPVSGMKLK